MRLSDRRYRALISGWVAAALAAAALQVVAAPARALPARAAPARPATGQPGYLTLMFAHSAWTLTENCVPLTTGVVDLGQIGAALQQRQLVPTGTVVTGWVDPNTRRCIEHLPLTPVHKPLAIASWADLTSLRATYGWRFVSHSVDYATMTKLPHNKQVAEACDSLTTLQSQGFPEAAGLFSYPNDFETAAINSNVVLPCGYTLGRRYGGPTNTPSSLLASHFLTTSSSNGGACNAPSLSCYTLPTPYRYLSPIVLANRMKPSPGTWQVVQMYRLVTGSKLSGINQWDCSSSDWHQHWTSGIDPTELYCWTDYTSALDQIPSGVVTSDPATIEAAWGITPPTVTAVSPGSGPPAGGSTVTITGTNFTGAGQVMFGTSAATSFSVDSAIQITATTPPEAAGTVDVTVVTPAGVSATSPGDRFTYEDVPTVSAVSPVSGPPAGGSTVTVTGTNFTGATAVRFGGKPATAFTVDSATQITATTPTHPVGAVDVTVATPSGVSATSEDDRYTYQDAPTVTAVNPASGNTAGGSTVTITGTNFIGTGQVMFGTSAATNFSVDSATQITATSPPEAAGTVDVTVATPAGVSPTSPVDQYTYQDTPTVTAVSPMSGPPAGGSTVIVTGTSFAGASQVLFGASTATNFSVDSATQITATTPPEAAGTVDVIVVTPAGVSATSPGDRFTYEDVPTVSAVSPMSGPPAGGSTVTVTGTNFTGATAVRFGGKPATAFTVDSATQITATTPSHPLGAVDVTVATPSGVSATSEDDRYTYQNGPTVTSVSPASGHTSGGYAVKITGTNFTSATAARFGAKAATVFTVDSATQITATAPPGAAGTVDVTVATPAGVSAISPADRFTYIRGPS